MHHVLLVDDDEHVRAALHAGLDAFGFRVTSAARASDAIALAELDPPDVVVTDVVMPGMLGIDLAAHLVQRNIPVLVLTGVPEARRHLGSVGWRHLEKPVRLAALLSELDSMLAEAEQNLAMVRATFARSFHERSELLMAIHGLERRRIREGRAELLRRRIAACRRCLDEGVDAALVRRYLAEISDAESHLRQLEEDDRQQQQ
jgi:CheY-like chemotaxis protein